MLVLFDSQKKAKKQGKKKNVCKRKIPPSLPCEKATHSTFRFLHFFWETQDCDD